MSGKYQCGSLGWVVAHLLEDGKKVLVQRRHNRALQQGDERLFVRVHLGRQPQRRPDVALNVVGACMGKRVAAEYADKAREMREVLLRITIGPPRRRVRAKRQ